MQRRLAGNLSQHKQCTSMHSHGVFVPHPSSRPTSIAAKSAEPTPTMSRDRGRWEADTIACTVLAMSMMQLAGMEGGGARVEAKGEHGEGGTIQLAASQTA